MDGLQGDFITFFAAISACAQGSRWQHAVLLLQSLALSRPHGTPAHAVPAHAGPETDLGFQGGFPTSNLLIQPAYPASETPNLVLLETNPLFLGATMIFDKNSSRRVCQMRAAQPRIASKQNLHLPVIACAAAAGACETCEEWPKARPLLDRVHFEGMDLLLSLRAVESGARYGWTVMCSVPSKSCSVPDF